MAAQQSPSEVPNRDARTASPPSLAQGRYFLWANKLSLVTVPEGAKTHVCTHACVRFIIEPRYAQNTREILKEGRPTNGGIWIVVGFCGGAPLWHDRIGIAFENENSNEDEPEAGITLPLLRDCEFVSNVLRVVHVEFVRLFEARNSSPEGQYAEIVSEIWRLRQPYRHRPPRSCHLAEVKGKTRWQQ